MFTACHSRRVHHQATSSPGVMRLGQWNKVSIFNGWWGVGHDGNKTAALARCNIRCLCACFIAITDQCWRTCDPAKQLKDGSKCCQQTCPTRMRGLNVCENTHMITTAVNETDASLGLFTVTKRRNQCCQQHAKAHSQRCLFWPFVFTSYDAHRPVRCPSPTVHAEAWHAVARPQQTHVAKTTRGRKWSMDACQHPLLNYACTAGPKYPHTTHWILLHKRQCVFAAATHTKCAKKERAQPQPRRASLHAHLSNRTHAWAKRFTPHATFTATVAQ